MATFQERLPGTYTDNLASLRMFHVPSITDKDFCSSEVRRESKFTLFVVIQDLHFTLGCKEFTFQRTCFHSRGHVSDWEKKSVTSVECRWNGAGKIDKVRITFLTLQCCLPPIRNSTLESGGDFGLTWVRRFSKWGLGLLEVEASENACGQSDFWDLPRPQSIKLGGWGVRSNGLGVCIATKAPWWFLCPLKFGNQFPSHLGFISILLLSQLGLYSSLLSSPLFSSLFPSILPFLTFLSALKPCHSGLAAHLLCSYNTGTYLHYSTYHIVL